MRAIRWFLPLTASVVPVCAAAVVLVCAAAPMLPAVAAPKVVASIKPVHSLVAGVMQGVGVPYLLLRGAGSPHSYALKPSDSRALARADLVVRIGEELETFLQKPLAALAGTTTVLSLHDARGVVLLPTREGGLWEREPEEGEHETHGGRAARDMHIWLSPANTKAMVAAIAVALAEADPANAARYAANARAVTARIDAHDKALAARLAPIRDKPFVVFHDAYQYFERHYGLSAAGTISVTPDRRPGPRRLRDIRRRIEKDGIACIFSEPQFRPALVRTVAEGTPARHSVLDPLGANLPPGPEMWFALTSGLAAALIDCLEK